MTIQPNTFAEQFKAAVEAAPLRDLDALSSRLWAGHLAGALTDDQAGHLLELIYLRRGSPSGARSLAAVAPTRRYRIQRSPEQRSPDRLASIARRRQLAATAPLPPSLAAKFTTGELAVLKVIADEWLAHGACDLSQNEIAARAGVVRTVVKRAIFFAEHDHSMIKVERRPRSGRKHLTNIIRIIRAEWRDWLSKGHRKAYAIAACARAKPIFAEARGAEKNPPRAQVLKQTSSDRVRDRKEFSRGRFCKACAVIAMTATAPYDVEAEQALLGSLLINNQTFFEMGFLWGGHFFEPRHHAIFDVIEALIHAGKVATPVTLNTMKPFLPADFNVEGLTVEYLACLVKSASDANDACGYARRIFDLAVCRQSGDDLPKGVKFYLDSRLAFVFEPYTGPDDLDVYVPYNGRRIVREIAGDDFKGLPLLNEVRTLYWTTDISGTEIRDAYFPGRFLNIVPMVAGHVWSGRRCAALIPELGDKVCGDLLFRWSRSQSSRGSGHSDTCEVCTRTSNRMTPARRKEAAEWAARFAAQYPSPPDPGLSYSDYLQTDHWQATRRRALRRAGYSCQVCSGKGELHVHHRTYARRGHELDSDLIVLCAGCHEMFHANGKLADGGRAL